MKKSTKSFVILASLTFFGSQAFAESRIAYLDGAAASTLFANLNGPNVNVRGNIKSILLETRLSGATEIRKFIECKVYSPRDSGEVETTCEIIEQINDV